MLVGSGGVVALVVGAWAVLWAVLRVPGTTWRTWYPTVVAFAAVILAFTMLTAQSEIGLGAIQWARAEPERRPDIAADTLGSSARPFVAAAVALLAFGAAVIASRKPGSPLDERTPHVVERAAVAGIGLLAVVDLGVWVVLRRLFAAGITSRTEWTTAVPALHRWSWAGVFVTVTLLGLAAFLGAWRGLRR